MAVSCRENRHSSLLAGFVAFESKISEIVSSLSKILGLLHEDI